jgi:hypothetical protein
MGDVLETMEAVVAVKVIDKKRGMAVFLTWGRVFDPTNPEPLKEAVALAAAEKFGFKDIASIDVCECLQEVSDHKYFYEGIIAFSGKPVPSGREKYRAWAARMRRGIKTGKELYLLGAPWSGPGGRMDHE